MVDVAMGGNGHGDDFRTQPEGINLVISPMDILPGPMGHIPHHRNHIHKDSTHREMEENDVMDVSTLVLTGQVFEF